MDRLTVFPDKKIKALGRISELLLQIGMASFHDACRFVHGMPYGYNSDREDLMILFKEKMGTCTTKHAVIATLAEEINLPVTKSVGIYAMTEEIVTGTQPILKKFDLPYIPMLHCFLVYDQFRVDLTEGNRNGKNCPIDDFLYTEQVIPHISGKDEYLLYRKALKDDILSREKLAGIDIKTVLQAREEGLKVLKANVAQ
jgi:hypothetical protein